MASMRDFVPAVRAVGPIRFVRKVWKEIVQDDLFTLAAALAYAWLFAIFPFLIFLLTLFAYIPHDRKVSAYEQIAAAINKIMAHDAAQTILTNLDQVLNEPKTGLLGIGIVVTIWVASGGMSMTMSALDAAYDVPNTRPFYMQRPVAIGLTIVVTTLILAVLLLLPVGTAVMHWLTKRALVPIPLLWLLNFIRYGLAILLMFLVLSLLYRFGASVKTSFSFFSPGAVFTVLVWILLGAAFRFYVDKFGRYQQTYGALGGVTIILFFFYIDALVLLIGAEINSEVDRALNPITGG